ncbi:universal stress protein [Saliphagus infecundisoli]|uniref:Universal stress protein n=1 Tax=Saliphagus infecundisoli TaxID=1849069 RepID=A0ABD5QJ76_9EURY|nr:universal stress protein [Saliphagus infecundisoli]
MPEHVLVPIDGSPQSTEALERATDLFPEARITLLYVADPTEEESGLLEGPGGGASGERDRDRAERLFEAATAGLDAPDATIETEVVTGSPWREIVEYVEREVVDHVVMGSHGRDGAARLLLGSVAELVVRRSSAPVTVVK